MYSTFDWPVPAAWERAPGDDFSGPEPALLAFVRGQKIQGTLTRFLPTHSVVEFLPARGRVNLDVPLSDVLYLRLTRPVALRPHATPIAGVAQVPAAGKQPYRVELVSGEVLEGETCGFEVHSAGLFLYVPNYGENVIRSFVPASAIKSQQLGKPLGELLVEEQVVTESQVRSGLDRQRELREQKLGDILAEQQVITREQLRQALERQRTMPMVRLGDALVESNRITKEQLEQALAHQKDNRKKQLGQILIDLGHINRVELYRALSQKLGIPSVDLKKLAVDPQAVKTLPDEVVREFSVMPVCFDGQALVVAMSNPLDPVPVEKIRFFTQRAVRPVLALPEEIEAAIGQHYGSAAGQRAEELADRLVAESAESGAEEEPLKETDSTLVRLVNKMIMDAHAAGASDIHVEANPGRKNVGIRFRRDGTLTDYLQVSSAFRGAMVSRIKIMANLDISEKRRAQDGRINFRQFGPLNIELRVAIVPTSEGLEDVVMRLLNAGEPLPIVKLGLRAPVRSRIEELLGRSYGLLLVVGPTGSGKTTTLHSLLGVINSPERKIWTAEDPIEITQAGLRQVQVNARIGWSFAAALRSFLRADPDVVMIGEMRDAETASIAIEASLTGHLVFSTLHTNSAPETVVRLLEMGMDPFSFADSLIGVLAQRLARRLCDECKTARPMTAEEQARFGQEYCHGTALQEEAVLAGMTERHGKLMLFSAQGCDKCRRTGYRGRIGLHELLTVDVDLRQRIQRRAPATELRAVAVDTGMRTLRQDGMEKALEGLTDLTEVRAVA